MSSPGSSPGSPRPPGAPRGRPPRARPGPKPPAPGDRARRSATWDPRYREMLRRLRDARRALGLTQAQVAAALGRPVSYVNKLELGERRADPIDLWYLAAVYRRPVADFLPAEPPDLGPLPERP